MTDYGVRLQRPWSEMSIDIGASEPQQVHEPGQIGNNSNDAPQIN